MPIPLFNVPDNAARVKPVTPVELTAGKEKATPLPSVYGIDIVKLVETPVFKISGVGLVVILPLSHIILADGPLGSDYPVNNISHPYFVSPDVTLQFKGLILQLYPGSSITYAEDGVHSIFNFTIVSG